MAKIKTLIPAQFGQKMDIQQGVGIVNIDSNGIVDKDVPNSVVKILMKDINSNHHWEYVYPMIQSLELKNFKSIKHRYFPLQNLNVLAGLNGMGKSSFIQALLLLKYSSGSSLFRDGVLLLKNPLINIGKSNDAFYQYSKDDSMLFDIKFHNSANIAFDFLYEKGTDFFKTRHSMMIAKSYNKNALFGRDCVQYLNANRGEPAEIHYKNYTQVVNLRDIGKNGENTVHFLSHYGSDDVAFDNLRHPNSVSNDLKEQVNRWMGVVSPGIRLNVTEIPNTEAILLDMQYEQRNLGFTNRFNPTNVGFGISYSLPVVTALLAARAGDLIIVENPESHIHPRGQVEIGKLIALTAMNDVQVIIETHSDHIINGIRVAVKEQKIEKDKVAIFYFEREITDNEQFSKITEIKIDQRGELSEYPDNFMDEWSNQMLNLL